MIKDEKRKKTRVSRRLEVKFNLNSENTAITSDLSENGMFITTCKGVEPGSEIDIRLHLPNSEALSIRGKVVRHIKSAPGVGSSTQKGMGVELVSPPTDYISFVQSLLK